MFGSILVISDRMPPQVSLYIDALLYMEIRTKAKDNGVSLSSYVCGVLKKDVDNGWPEGFFELFGSLKGSTISEPEELPWSMDTPREEL